MDYFDLFETKSVLIKKWNLGRKLRRANINLFSLLGERFLAHLVLMWGALWRRRASARLKRQGLFFMCTMTLSLLHTEVMCLANSHVEWNRIRIVCSSLSTNHISRTAYEWLFGLISYPKLTISYAHSSRLCVAGFILLTWKVNNT